MQREVFFHSYVEARDFAQKLLMENIKVSRIHIAKKRVGSMWSVIYSEMSKRFMEEYSIH